MNTRQEIINSIVVVGKDDEYTDLIKEGLSKSRHDLEPLRNLTFVQIETTARGGHLQNCEGVDMAMEIITKDPNCRMLLYGILPLEYIRKKKQNIDILLAKPNVRFLRMPFHPDTIVEEFIAAANSSKYEITADEVALATEKHIQNSLSSIWHDIKKAPDPLHPTDGWQKSCVVSGIAKAKEVFPMLADMDDAFILQFLEETSAKREEVRKGETFSGIFCDMEGTLFSNGTLNNAVLEFLRKYEVEGKEVRLWSDGNLSELQPLLDANNITYQLNAKRDFAGAIVEIAIDDMDEYSFSAITKVFAKEFKQVGSIFA